MTSQRPEPPTDPYREPPGRLGLPAPAPVRSSGADWQRGQFHGSMLGSRRSLGSLWLTLALAGVLLPAWLGSGAAFRPDVHQALGSPWLPAATALLIGVRAGGLNLGLWGVTALGSALAWWGVSAGLTPPMALLGALAAGALTGLAQAALTAGLYRLLKARLSGGAALLAASGVGTGALGAALLAGARAVHATAGLRRLPATMLMGYNNPEGLVVLSAMFFVVTLAGLMLLERRVQAGRWNSAASPGRLLVALIAGGMLAAATGVLLLLAHSEYLPYNWLLGDLRIVLAVLLSGAWVWRGRGSAILAGALLPAGMVVATIWREMIPAPHGVLACEPLLAPIVLVAVLQTVLRGRRYPLLWAITAAACTAGVLLAALSSYWLLDERRQTLLAWGLGVWTAGAALGFYRLWRRRGASALAGFSSAV